MGRWLTHWYNALDQRNDYPSLFSNPSVAGWLIGGELVDLYADLVRVFDKRKSLIAYFGKRAAQTRRRGSLRYIAYHLMLDRAREGCKLSDILDGLVPTSHILLLATGERAKDTAGGIRRILRVAETEKRIMVTIAKNVGPAVIAMLMAGLILISTYGAKIVPPMAKIIGSLEPIGPALTTCFYIAEWFKGDWVELSLMAGLAAGYGIYRSLGSWTGRTRALAESPFLFPLSLIYKIYRIREMAIQLMVLSAVLRAKETPARACELMAARANPFTAEHLLTMRDRFANGEAPAVALDTGFFDQTIVERVEIGQDDGEFNVVMEALSTTYFDDTLKIVHRTSLMIGGMIFLATVAFITGVILDYFTLQDAVQSAIDAKTRI
ncbi:type II secretion system F family protein [Chitinimonas sp. BJB300]|uniref:type II secretion system F family protein n=1 Tax=Chitinimonas sp. BJB300 TaxID=1559339 RepID=UPI000C0C9136|nr:type II secretion system F family protein [Chitinimonas sp. BJB300]PHV12041.1 hypothetical protein CSQ89_07825 [Chitinimonas sp. BJB300]TSJ84922.1 hypothetical protein FG002_018360 [Chitinimonas sp. BJB300]